MTSVNSVISVTLSVRLSLAPFPEPPRSLFGDEHEPLAALKVDEDDEGLELGSSELVQAW
jgi:hypothetical protein